MFLPTAKELEVFLFLFHYQPLFEVLFTRSVCISNKSSCHLEVFERMLVERRRTLNLDVPSKIKMSKTCFFSIYLVVWEKPSSTVARIILF